MLPCKTLEEAQCRHDHQLATALLLSDYPAAKHVAVQRSLQVEAERQAAEQWVQEAAESAGQQDEQAAAQAAVAAVARAWQELQTAGAVLQVEVNCWLEQAAARWRQDGQEAAADALTESTETAADAASDALGASPPTGAVMAAVAVMPSPAAADGPDAEEQLLAEFMAIAAAEKKAWDAAPAAKGARCGAGSSGETGAAQLLLWRRQLLASKLASAELARLPERRRSAALSITSQLCHLGAALLGGAWERCCSAVEAASRSWWDPPRSRPARACCFSPLLCLLSGLMLPTMMGQVSKLLATCCCTRAAASVLLHTRHLSAPCRVLDMGCSTVPF